MERLLCARSGPMPRLPHARLTIAALLVVATLPPSGDAQMAPRQAQTPASSARTAPDGLRLVLTTEKPRVQLGEPVYVIAELANAGSSPIDVFKNLDPEVGALQLEIVGPPGTFAFVPYSIADSEIQLEPLSPGSLVTAVVPIFYGGRGWTFTQAGDYRITARYQNPGASNQDVASAPLAITVVEGDGAGAFLMRGDTGDEAGKFLLWQQGDHLRKGIRRLTDLIERYPDSPLADYAQLALGLNLSRAFRDHSIGELRQPDYEAARRYLQQVRRDRLPPSLQVEGNLAAARGSLKRGAPEDARRLVQEARQVADARTYLLGRIDEVLARTPGLR